MNTYLREILMPSTEDKLIPFRGLLILLGTATFTVGTILSGRFLLIPVKEKLNPNISQEKLWKIYRWSADPYQRREASLLLVSKSPNSLSRRERLLKGQGWGNDSLSAVALKLQAENYYKLGKSINARDIWVKLLDRFPVESVSADAFYRLGMEMPDLRKDLLELHPAHPAALASALELEKQGNNRHQGAIHLAKWGERWPGAEVLIRNACLNPQTKINYSDSQFLSKSLARLGDWKNAMSCTYSKPLLPETTIAIALTLLEGNFEQRERGKLLLKQLSESKLNKLKINERKNINNILIQNFPEEFISLNKPFSSVIRKSAFKDVKRNIPLEIFGRNSFLKLLQNNPSILQLHWKLTRNALLQNKWQEAISLLNVIPPEQLPEPIAARQIFWMGLVEFKLGNTIKAQHIWENLVEDYSPNYYTWRASQRLGLYDWPSLNKNFSQTSLLSKKAWTPLSSKNKLVNQLWRLGLEKEAWETWRNKTITPHQDNQNLMEKLVEGRLRMGVGDYWMGLFKVREVSRLFVGDACLLRKQIFLNQYPLRFSMEIEKASKETGVRQELIYAIANQESRFSPNVKSSAGAIGLMQLMPATALEMKRDEVITNTSLLDPGQNSLLGARYLNHLLTKWNNNPFLTVASYNAGPMAVSEWITTEIEKDPELWVEKIPYPETRFYTKKVLGNLYSYLNYQKEFCVSKV